MANYMFVGAKQLGITLFEVENGKMKLNFDKDTVMQPSWDNYWRSICKGVFCFIR